MRTEVLPELRVMFEPPERGPNEDCKLGAGVTHSLQFSDGGGIVGRRPPVLAVPFQKRQRALPHQGAAKVLLVHQDEGDPRWNELSDLFACPLQPREICRLGLTGCRQLKPRQAWPRENGEQGGTV